MPEYARPERLRVEKELPLTGGFRTLKAPVRRYDFSDGAAVYRWDTRALKLVPTI